jgi:type IV secretory pathway VirB2 component (pilin)
MRKEVVMFTRTTKEGKKDAPIQAPALNSTIWGGLATAVAAIGAATAGVFSAMNVTEWEVRVAIVAGVTLVIAVGLWGLVVLIRNDMQTRLTGATAKNMGAPKPAGAVSKPAKAEGIEGNVAWITPPSMHVYSAADPATPLQVILVGIDKDKIYYYAAAEGGKPEILTAEGVHHVQLAEHLFR